MRKRAIAAAAVLGVAATALAATSGAAPTSTATPVAPLHLVVLGDSTAQASRCPGCTDYAHLYAQDIQRATGRVVQVDNRGAPRDGFLPMLQGTQALANVYADQSLRRAIADADVVVVGLGFNDTAWNRFDDPCEATPDYPIIHWDEISEDCQRRVTHENKQTLDVLLTQVNQLRGGKPTLLRVVSSYDNVIDDTGDPGWDTPDGRRVAKRGNTLMTSAQCELAGFHGGRCADVLHTFNGPGVDASAQRYLVDGTHLNQAGHRQVARLLADLGYSPLLP
jgi:lysophospholipase L1-like esterase